MELTRMGGKARVWMQEILHKERPYNWDYSTYFTITNDGREKGDTVWVAHPDRGYTDNGYDLPERLVPLHYIATENHSRARDTPYLFFESDVREYAKELLKKLDRMG